MNTKTILSYAREITNDMAIFDELLSDPLGHRKSELQQMNVVFEGNVMKYFHEHYDQLARITTSFVDLTTYQGECADAINSFTKLGFGTLLRKNPKEREEECIKSRGIEFNELVRRDTMRAVANSEWLWNKQVFEFTDELLLSLIENPTLVSVHDILKREGLSSEIFGDAPDWMVDTAKKDCFIEARFYIDRIQYMPFRTFVLDVSGNRLFKSSPIKAFQITPIHYPENKRAVIHVESILESGTIRGVFTYDVNYNGKSGCMIQDPSGGTYARVMLFYMDGILDILHGTKRFPVEPDPTQDFMNSTLETQYNTIIGYIVCQVLNYLGSDGTDIKESTDTKSTYKKSGIGTRIKNSYKEIQKWDCGIRYAQSVKKYQATKESTVTTGTGSPKKPHVRRAHWHHYWTGSGNEKKLIRKWLPSMNINMDFTSELPIVVRVES